MRSHDSGKIAIMWQLCMMCWHCAIFYNPIFIVWWLFKAEDFDIVFLNHINVVGMHRSIDCPMKKVIKQLRWRRGILVWQAYLLFFTDVNSVCSALTLDEFLWKRLSELLREATGFYNTHRHTAPVADIERERIRSVWFHDLHLCCLWSCRTCLQQQALTKKSLMAQYVNFTLAPHAMELDHIVTIVACALLNPSLSFLLISIGCILICCVTKFMSIVMRWTREC